MARRTAGPVGQGASSRRYYGQLQRAILSPLLQSINARLRRSRNTYLAKRQAIRDIPIDPSMAGLAGAAASVQYQRLKQKHIREFERVMRRELGIHFRVRDSGRVQQAMNAFIDDNVHLIVTIPYRFLDAMTVDLQKLADAEEAFDQEKLSKLVSGKYQSSGYNLYRITRDQTNKAIGQLNEIRQMDAGITEYVWSTSDDVAVRSNHRFLDESVQKWTAPPMGGGTSGSEAGHPGSGILCRCVALAVIPAGKKR